MKSRHGSLESSILNVLWEFESKNLFKNSVKDVYDCLSKNDSDRRAYTTIKTVMDRLVKKKFLLKFKSDNKYCYRTAYSNNEIIFNSLRLIADRYCDGNMSKLSEIISSVSAKECVETK